MFFLIVSFFLSFFLFSFGRGTGHWLTGSAEAPGFCTNNFKLVYLHVDLSLPENQQPQTHLEDDEFIERFTIPVASLFSELKKLQRDGYGIEARVVGLSEGIEIARNWSL